MRWTEAAVASVVVMENHSPRHRSTRSFVLRESMKLPETLEITNSCYLLDGGTTALTCVDENGEEHNVLLAQHAFRDGAIG
jgi:hypothetical protein